MVQVQGGMQRVRVLKAGSIGTRGSVIFFTVTRSDFLFNTTYMIDVIFPTRTEARHFDAPEGVRVHFCGVGLTDAAIFIAGLLAKEERPEAVVMGGIAGVYPHSRFKIGDTVIVEKEREADLGFFYPDGFRLLARMDNVLDFPISEWITCPWIDERITLPRASSNSMNAAMAPFAPTDDADIENMEGAPFFKACTRAGVPFFELRTISNEVDLNRKEWDYEGSIKKLGHHMSLFVRSLAEAMPNTAL